jgi:glucuronoarabinoxylan endo-1,4-beta-xylanase
MNGWTVTVDLYACGSTGANLGNSQTAILTVNPATGAPTITTQPASQTVTTGQTATFAVVASGTAPLSYQWQKNGANISGATSASYTTPVTASADNGSTFKVVVSNSAGSVTSSAATLTVNAVSSLAVSITSPTNGASVSGTITVSGAASDSLALTLVQLSVDSGSFSNASGTTSWTFSLDTAALSNATHTLTAKATDSSGNTATSNPVSITVNNTTNGTAVTVDWSTTYQTIEGFGAATAFQNGNPMTGTEANLLFSTTSGAGLSLIRCKIESNGTYPYVSNMQMAIARGARAWCSPWSPPASMKNNGSIDNGGSLLAGSYQAWADYLTNYISTLQNTYNVPIYALSVQNEPNYTATYESCIWTGQNFHDFILNNLGPDLASHGLTTKIMMPEEAQWVFDLASTTLNDSSAAAYVSIVAAHNYSYASASAYPLGQGLGKELWETEVSNFGAFDASMSDALYWGQQINDWMVIANANAWHYWWALASDGSNQGLINNSGGSDVVAKRLWVMGNYSRFVRPGWVRIGATATPISGVSVSAYKDTSTGNFAIVVINRNAASETLSFTLSGFTANTITPWETSASLNLAQQPSISVGGSAFTVTLPASSVTTLVGK